MILNQTFNKHWLLSVLDGKREISRVTFFSAFDICHVMYSRCNIFYIIIIYYYSLFIYVINIHVGLSYLYYIYFIFTLLKIILSTESALYFFFIFFKFHLAVSLEINFAIAIFWWKQIKSKVTSFVLFHLTWCFISISV